VWPDEWENKFLKGFKMFVFGGKMELSLRDELQDRKPWETSIIRGCEMLMLVIRQWFSVIRRITVLKAAFNTP